MHLLSIQVINLRKRPRNPQPPPNTHATSHSESRDTDMIERLEEIHYLYRSRVWSEIYVTLFVLWMHWFDRSGFFNVAKRDLSACQDHDGVDLVNKYQTNARSLYFITHISNVLNHLKIFHGVINVYNFMLIIYKYENIV